MRILNEAQWNILIFVEEYWGKRGNFPRVKTIAEKTNLTEPMITEAISDPLFKEALDRRGITFIESDRLTEQQMAVAMLVANVYDHRSIAEKCKACGISTATYYNWKKDPHFSMYMREVTENMFGDYMPEVHQALVKNAVSGDFKSIEMYYKISGRFNDKDSSGVDLKVIMNTIVEVAQRTIRDKDALKAFAEGLEQELTGTSVIRGELSG